MTGLVGLGGAPVATPIWGYGDAKPDHYFVAPNYRWSELQGAVALAQLGRGGARGKIVVRVS